MKTNLNDLINAMSEQISHSDILAANELAKISAVIAKRRIEMNMNQKQFAEFVGVSQSMVSKWESEDYNFTVESLAKICERLNLSLDISIKEQNKQCIKALRVTNPHWSVSACNNNSIEFSNEVA